MKFSIKYSCVSHRGRVRTNNEDNFLCDCRSSKPDNIEPIAFSGVLNPDSCPVACVFDGMGGEECGEMASYIATQVALTYRFNPPVESLKDFCVKSNREICKYSDANGIGSMGTTAAMLVFHPDAIYLCNVGDSRVYRLYKNELQQISKDHIVTIDGRAKPYLSQNLGIPETELKIEPYIASGDYYNGDVYVICSDGLTDMVPNEEITRILKSNPFETAAQALLNKALENGGKDNTTIILCRVQRDK